MPVQNRLGTMLASYVDWIYHVANFNPLCYLLTGWEINWTRKPLYEETNKTVKTKQFCIFYAFAEISTTHFFLTSKLPLFVLVNVNNMYGGFFFFPSTWYMLKGRRQRASLRNPRWLPGNYPDSHSALFNQSLVIYSQLKQTKVGFVLPLSKALKSQVTVDKYLAP